MCVSNDYHFWHNYIECQTFLTLAEAHLILNWHNIKRHSANRYKPSRWNYLSTTQRAYDQTVENKGVNFNCSNSFNLIC